MKRRLTLKWIVGILGGASLPVASCAPVQKTDSRVLGTWISDKQRTIDHWCWTNKPTTEDRKRLGDVFGKFTLRFTETHIFTEFEELRESVPYSVVASDETSVVIAWHGERDRPLQHIHFEEGGYYILSGYNVEFYRRVET